jgi:ubiquinone/menaquinone biosynthesis C-methylase UbiE
MTLYPDTLFKQTFGRVHRHRLVGDIIRRFSNNRTDIYELALKNLHFRQPVKVLDIGCGYGRFTSALKQRVPAGSRCTGLDLLSENRRPFLETARHIDPHADFITGSADLIESMADDAYDLIISAYSLYFFSALIPQLARILKPDGHLVIINHSRRFLNELIQDITLTLSQSPFAGKAHLEHEQLLDNFNDENGTGLLEPHFKNIDRINYQNQLSFPLSELDQCLVYIDFKLPLLIRVNQSGTDADLTRFKEILFKIIRQESQVSGIYTLNKNDCIFRCSRPVKRDAPNAG